MQVWIVGTDYAPLAKSKVREDGLDGIARNASSFKSLMFFGKIDKNDMCVGARHYSIREGERELMSDPVVKVKQGLQFTSTQTQSSPLLLASRHLVRLVAATLSTLVTSFPTAVTNRNCRFWQESDN